MHRLLAALFTNTLNAKQKIDIINKEYDIPVESDIEEGVSIMCNLSQGVKEKGIAIGESIGEERGITIGEASLIKTMYNNGITIEQIANMTNKNIEDIMNMFKIE